MAAGDIKKLKEGGINTVDALAHASKRELVAIKGLSEAKIDKIQKEGVSWVSICRRDPACCTAMSLLRVLPASSAHCHAIEVSSCMMTAWKLVPMGFTTATMIAEQRQDMIQVSTGCKELDSVLEGALSSVLPWSTSA